jgi:oligopeptide/dipeptide ABC transporter ATP-binding protein
MLTPIIELQNITRTFQLQHNQVIAAVNDVSLSIAEGEIMCLVGESGCGKTTTGKLIVDLLKPSKGRILYKGWDVSTLSGQRRKEYRLGVQLIHQDPYASLNPTHTVYQILAAPIKHHGFASGETAVKNRIKELLEMVDLAPANNFLDRFPHQLSGGQRQRISIARALTVNPSFLVADEAVSLMDVSVRISLLNMLRKLKEKMGLSVLFITHDLALARYFAWEGRIGVMYLGKLVELSPARQLVEHPQHPYTHALLSAVPEADPDVARQKKQIELRSMDIPSLLNQPSGCNFHPRCPFWEGKQCETIVPTLKFFNDGSSVACHPIQRERSAALIENF